MKKQAQYGASNLESEVVELYQRRQTANQDYEDAFFVDDSSKARVQKARAS